MEAAELEKGVVTGMYDRDRIVCFVGMRGRNIISEIG